MVESRKRQPDARLARHSTKRLVVNFGPISRPFFNAISRLNFSSTDQLLWIAPSPPLWKCEIGAWKRRESVSIGVPDDRQVRTVPDEVQDPR